MKVKIKDVICNTDTCAKCRKYMRTTREQPHPRVTLVKKELPCYPRYNPDFWFNYVTVEKYIDDVLVKTYHWIQSINDTEREEFTGTPSPPREKPDRKEYMHQYYIQHKDKRKESEERREELREKARQWYLKHREEKIQKVKEYKKNKKNNQPTKKQ